MKTSSSDLNKQHREASANDSKKLARIQAECIEGDID
jgi:hypothetical protein